MVQATKTHEDLATLAEQHVRRWALSDEMREYMLHAREASPILQRVGPHIAISREAGSGGGEIARAVGRVLEWDVLDKELLDFIAQRYNLRRKMLDFVDETKSNWIHDVFGSWFDAHVVSHQKYLVDLERVIWLAGVHGRVVIVGRGAQFILPKEEGLRVRIVAPIDFRIERTMQNHDLSREEAQSQIENIDRQRHEFIREFFHQNVADPKNYDLVVDSSQLDSDRAAENIVEVYRQR